MSPRRSRRLVRQERKLPAKLLEEGSAAVCCFCKKAQSSIVCDKLLNGKITAHFYCLLFSSGLQQRGDVGGPLMGFLEADIMIELRRGSKLRCVYCKKQGATLGCCIKMCKKVFHVDCGNASDCLLQFYGDYRAYCPYHRPHQRIRPKESGSTSCLICACDMVSEPSPQVLVTPCCQHSFHRACLQAQASSAGSYFFKCCTCNNIDAFQKEMLDHGICIPEQDASWEREQGAYQDLLYRYQRCDAERCRCPMGREASSEESGDWEVITCSTCGSQGIHKACGNLSREALQRANSWVCVQCRKTLSLRPGMEAVIPPSSPLKRKGAAASTSSEPPITKAKETEPPVPEKTEVLPAAATPCSGISPLSSSPCSMIVPPSSSPCPKILPLSGSPCPEIPRPSGSPCPKITPPSSSLCSKILPLSGSPCPEIPRPSGSPCPKITPPSSSPCSKILPLSGSPRPWIPPLSGSLSSSGEAAGAAGSSPQSQKGGDDDSDVEIIAWYPKRSPPQFIVLDDSDDSEDSDLLCACPDCLP